MILGQHPDSVLGPLSSKPPGLEQICLNPEVLGPLSPNHLQQICMILALNPDSVLGSWSSKHLWTTLFTVYLHDLGTKSRFSFRTLILQTSCFAAYLHDLGTTVNLDSVFGSWSFKKKDETNVYKCLQKPLIHDANLILEILLFGSWSSKLPSF